MRRLIALALQSREIIFAETAADRSLLARNNTPCILLSCGKYLVTDAVAAGFTLRDRDAVCRVLRMVIHEDIEAIMQIYARDNRHVYQGIKELILEHLPPPDGRELSDELYVNHTLARAFEWLSLIEEKVIALDEIPARIRPFIETIAPVINAHRHNYFTEAFWDPAERGKVIRRALNRGMCFYQVNGIDRALTSQSTDECFERTYQQLLHAYPSVDRSAFFAFYERNKDRLGTLVMREGAPMPGGTSAIRLAKGALSELAPDEAALCYQSGTEVLHNDISLDGQIEQQQSIVDRSDGDLLTALKGLLRVDTIKHVGYGSAGFGIHQYPFYYWHTAHVPKEYSDLIELFLLDQNGMHEIIQDADARFTAIRLQLRQVNPALDRAVLWKVYTRYKDRIGTLATDPVKWEDTIKTKAYAQSGEITLLYEVITEDRFKFGIYDEPDDQDAGATGNPSSFDTVLVSSLKNILQIPTVRPCQKWFRGGGRHRWGFSRANMVTVPSAYAYTAELYILAREDVHALISSVANKDYDGTNYAEKGIRFLGSSAIGNDVGNKERGFALFERLGIAYPPGIALSAELVKAILKSNKATQTAYMNLLYDALARAGVRPVSKFSVRSNPRTSMPGILTTVTAVERDDLLNAIKEVAASWDTSRAAEFRAREGIADSYDLPIIIQEWIDTSMTDTQDPLQKPSCSGAGAMSTRGPNTAKDGIFGTFLFGGAGEDLMTGGKNGLSIHEIATRGSDGLKKAMQELCNAAKRIEEEAGFPQEIEFVIRDNTIYFLQTRNLRFSPRGEIAYLTEMMQAGKLTDAGMVLRLERLQNDLGARRIYKIKSNARVQHHNTKAFISTGGAMQGYLTWDIAKAETMLANGIPTILVTHMHDRDRMLSMVFKYSTVGVITSYGNREAHEAVLLRIAGIPALINVAGVGDETIILGDAIFREGDYVGIDGGYFFTAKGAVLEEDRLVIDASFGIDIPSYRQKFLAQYLDADGTIKPSLTIDDLLALNDDAFRRYEDCAAAGDKRAAFIANLEKHFLHDLLTVRQRNEPSSEPRSGYGAAGQDGEPYSACSWLSAIFEYLCREGGPSQRYFPYSFFSERGAEALWTEAEKATTAFFCNLGFLAKSTGMDWAGHYDILIPPQWREPVRSTLQYGTGLNNPVMIAAAVQNAIYDKDRADLLIRDLLRIPRQCERSEYCIRYDYTKIKRPDEVAFLKACASSIANSGNMRVGVVGFNGADCPGETALNVYRKSPDGRVLGEGHVDLKTEVSLVSDCSQYYLGLGGMLNIAIAASHISEEEGADHDLAERLTGFIIEQCGALVGSDNVPADLLQNIHRIVLTLPRSCILPKDILEKHYRNALALYRAA